VNPEAAKEAIVSTAADVQVPQQSITGRIADPAAREAVNQTIAQGNVNIANKFADLAGGEAPHPTELVRHLEDAYVKSANGVKNAYDAAYSVPGQFHPTLPSIIQPEIEAQLARHQGIPTTLGEMASFPNFPQATAAMQFIEQKLSSMPASQLTMPKLEVIRKALGDFASNAEGSDKLAMHAVTSGFDNSLNRAVHTPGGFTGNGMEAEDAGRARRLRCPQEHVRKHDLPRRRQARAGGEDVISRPP
jgi:hypothetical protein